MTLTRKHRSVNAPHQIALQGHWRQGLVLCLATLVSTSMAAQERSRESFESVFIGAYDADAWNGIVFDAKASGQSLPFAIRIGSKSSGFLDGERVFNAVSLVGPHAPDGSYSLIGWRHYPRTATVSLEWSRIDETTVVGRITAPSDMHLVIEAYSPDSPYFTGAYGISSDGDEIIGEHHLDNVFRSAAGFSVVTDRPVLGSGIFSDVGQLRRAMDAGQLAKESNHNKSGAAGLTFPSDTLSGAAGLEFVTGGMSTAHFVAAIGWNASELSQQAHRLLEPGRIDTILNQKAEAYDKKRPHIQGMFGGAPEAIGNTMFWNTLYVPSLGLEFPSISRNWAHGFGGWVVGEWDCFFGSLLTDVEDPRQTSASIRAILVAQSPNGVVPNVDAASGTSPDRSQPPVGAYVVWKNYQRHADLDLLKWAYPRLKKWHEWWFKNRGDGQSPRDGNRNGLLEWGSDKGSTFSVGGRGFLQQAKWESGMDDSPMYDDAKYVPNTYTMDLDDVGLNSLYALDSECLAKIALILGEVDDSHKFATDYDRIRGLVRQKLWNEKDGMYENRFWDGHFSKRLSPTNFYPMLAGIATPEQAKRMVQEHLLNPREFWGQYVIPTISRTDPAFQDQYYWRGDIWGPTNYLVYEGLDRYGEDEVALQFAEKSYQLFMDDWKTHQHTDEQYYAWGGSAGGDTHYTWGALLCLIAMEQFINQNPWNGLRFGALQPSESGTLHNVYWDNHRYDIEVGPQLTSVTRDGELRFIADAGVVVRDYKPESNSFSFALKTLHPVRVTTREYSSGTLSLKVDNLPVQTLMVQHGAVTFAVAAGSHRIMEARPRDR